jgi:EpsI family protein
VGNLGFYHGNSRSSGLSEVLAMGNQRIRLAVVVAVLIATSFCGRAATHYRLEQRRLPNWSAISYRIGDWSGSDAQFDPLYGSDPADTALLRVYRQRANPPVIAYVGFFQDLATILDVHTPELCYPAQGWVVLESGIWKPGTFRGKHIPATRIVADKNGDRRLVVWWYNAGSRPFETRIRYVYAMLAMSTFTGRTDGSLVRLETPFNANNESGAIVRIEAFQRVFLPELERALPQ